jgi:hypothetical protein
LKDPAEFQALECLVQRLGADLETERAARSAADSKCDEATAAVQQLREHERQLRDKAHELDAELKASRERAFAVYSLESYVAELQKTLEERTSALNSRTHAAAVLAGQVEKLRGECEALRKRASEARSRDAVAPRQAGVQRAAAPATAERGTASHLLAQYERSLAQIPAYRLFKERDPGFYDGWLKEYQLLVGRGLSDKQLNDVLRSSQARWLERKLARASDQANIDYARLLVDQLDELMRDGVEPCLTLLVPQAKPARGVVPDYSRRTVERELDLLNMVLTTYDPRRSPPKENDVWPDLEPIFGELFETFGADNVAAIENSFDPGMDRSLLCEVSKTLFLRILALPEANAAEAVRWLLISK